jgi:hypothetical protein
MRGADDPRYLFIDFKLPGLAPRLNLIATAFLLPENISLFLRSVAYVKYRRQRGPDKHMVFGDIICIHTVQC